MDCGNIFLCTFPYYWYDLFMGFMALLHDIELPWQREENDSMKTNNKTL